MDVPQVVTIIRDMDYPRLEILTVDGPQHLESVQSPLFRKGWWRAIGVAVRLCRDVSREENGR